MGCYLSRQEKQNAETVLILANKNNYVELHLAKYWV